MLDFPTAQSGKTARKLFLAENHVRLAVESGQIGLICVNIIENFFMGGNVTTSVNPSEFVVCHLTPDWPKLSVFDVCAELTARNSRTFAAIASSSLACGIRGIVIMRTIHIVIIMHMIMAISISTNMQVEGYACIT